MKDTTKTRRLLMVGFALVPSFAAAANNIWDLVAEGDWFLNDNWSENRRPELGDTALVSQGTALITNDSPTGETFAQATNLRINGGEVQGGGGTTLTLQNNLEVATVIEGTLQYIRDEPSTTNLFIGGNVLFGTGASATVVIDGGTNFESTGVTPGREFLIATGSEGYSTFRVSSDSDVRFSNVDFQVGSAQSGAEVLIETGSELFTGGGTVTQGSNLLPSITTAITVRDLQSEWDARSGDGLLELNRDGFNAPPILSVLDGARVRAGRTRIESLEDTLAVLVRGVGEGFPRGARFDAGFLTTEADITVDQGGVLTADNLVIGRAASLGDAVLTIDGANSTGNISGSVRIGGVDDDVRNTGGIIVSGGASVSAEDTVIALAEGSNGFLHVSGNGSIYQSADADSSLSVASGTGSRGEIAVWDGGTVEVNNGAGRIELRTSGLASVKIGKGGVAGTLAVAEIHGISDSLPSNIILNHNESDYLFTPSLTGELFIAHEGPGITRFQSSSLSTYAGTTFISDGTVIAGSSNAFGTSQVTVAGPGKVVILNDVFVNNEFTARDGGVIERELNAGNFFDVGEGVSGEVAGGTFTFRAGEAQGPRTLSLAVNDDSSATNDNLRVSDVFSLTGTGTDAYVMEITIDPSLLGGNAAFAYIGWLNNTGEWVLASEGNTGNVGNSLDPFHGDWLDFLASNPGASDLSTVMGAFGVDSDTGQIWFVGNHNSDFAILIPEPQQVPLFMVFTALFGLWSRRRRNV